MKASEKNRILAFNAEKRGIVLTTDEAATLRRAEMTLTRWGERECGDGSDWAIERDSESSYVCTQCGQRGYGKHAETCHCENCGDIAPVRHVATGKPFNVYHGPGKSRRYRIPDLESGALRRVAAICDNLGLHWYHQTDPRGCALYIATEPLSDQNYSTRGVPCCV